MALFPVEEKVVALKEKQNKPANRQTSSAGYTMSFSRGTTLKKTFVIDMAYLSKIEKDEIQVFFDMYQGDSFSLNDPDPNSNEVYTVVFAQDELEFVYTRVFPGEYTLNFEATEV